MTYTPVTTRRLARGITLVELMVAMAIGLVVSLVVGTVFVQGSRSHSEDERYARLIENGRFALDQLTHSLRMAGFYGETAAISVTSTRPGPGVLCDIDLSQWEKPVVYTSITATNNNAEGDPDLLPFDPSACPQVLRGRVAGTGALALKHTTSTAITTGATNGHWYVEAKGSAEGEFRNDAHNDPLTASEIARGGGYWRYAPSLFYIARFTDENGLEQPYLCRSQWNGTGFVSHGSDVSARDSCLAAGIEHFHLQFGVDTDGDGVANRYSSTGSLALTEEEITARIYVLARTETPDPTYADDKVYVLGDFRLNMANASAADRQFHRRVFSSTVKLRNPYNRVTAR
ncbi:MAG: hypothetical protein RL434_1766 [Pseudomonadota bacterium]|jgi:type IV pilus assembly protein PilW